MRKILYLFLAGLFLVHAACAQPVGDLYAKTEYRIPMRDGVELYTAVYSPLKPVDAPILILRTPYGCGPYGEGRFPAGLEEGYLRSYVDRGYILVMQDVRGRYMSGGEYVNIRPAGQGETDETTDSYDTVDFLVQNVEGHNGRVGFTGCSYPGFYAMMGGLSAHPAVKAVSPQAPVTDWFMGDDTHHNGVLMLGDAFSFIPRMSFSQLHVPSETMPAASRIARPDDLYEFYLGCGTLDSLSRLLGDVPFWTEMAAHPVYDAWWQARDLRRACYNIRPAVLVVGGTFDAEDCFGAWNLFKAIRRQSPATECRLVIGPWSHGAWLSGDGRLGDFDFGEEAGWEFYVENFELPFFEYYLRDRGAPDDLPQVAVFTSGSDRWNTSAEWPPRSSREHVFYLTEEGKLADRKPQAKRSSSVYTSDPSDPVPYKHPRGTPREKAYMLADQRFTEGRSDVLTFVTEPLAEEMTLLGPVTASLETALSTTDADFVVRLIDCFPDEGDKAGYRMLVRGDVMRGRFRKSFSHPAPFVPGEVENVTFTMPDIAHTFRSGHRLMICIQSTWFPLAERSPQQFVDLWRCRAADFVPCDVRIFHQRDHASSIRVRVSE